MYLFGLLIFSVLVGGLAAGVLVWLDDRRVNKRVAKAVAEAKRSTVAVIAVLVALSAFQSAQAQEVITVYADRPTSGIGKIYHDNGWRLDTDGNWRNPGGEYAPWNKNYNYWNDHGNCGLACPAIDLQNTISTSLGGQPLSGFENRYHQQQQANQGQQIVLQQTSVPVQQPVNSDPCTLIETEYVFGDGSPVLAPSNPVQCNELETFALAESLPALVEEAPAVTEHPQWINEAIAEQSVTTGGHQPIIVVVQQPEAPASVVDAPVEDPAARGWMGFLLLWCLVPIAGITVLAYGIRSAFGWIQRTQDQGLGKAREYSSSMESEKWKSSSSAA